MNAAIRFCLENKLIVTLFVVCMTAWGVMVAPFDWKLDFLPRNPVPVDAIPDIGENQQIVFTKWPGRSPRDVEDQISYPLTVSLLGLSGVKTIRSFSYFGYSSIYIIFKDDIDFYWSRSRVLEKLSSLPQGLLPDDVSPALGPDATALGQVFWYTLEGRDPEGRPTGGWNLDEIRSVQDWYVRYALQGAEGVAEVASIGGFVKEYQIDINPDALRAYDVSLARIIHAVRNSNLDVGARTIEVNRVEYVIRGVGFIQTLQDIEDIAIAVRENNIPVQVKDVAQVRLGPALRRGALDKDGAEVVGGVVVVRYGENPLATIQNVRAKIEEISPGLPEKTFTDGTLSKLTIVPFYDRTGLILETLGTLKAALTEEILVTIIVVVVMVFHLMSAVLIALVLPLAILIAFILMQSFQVQANIVALSGIAIAIGTMVDMGIVLCENILFHLNAAPSGKSRLEIVYEATIEVAGAVRTAALTTVVSFLPVFALQAAEGKLFAPLAYTKTFALLGALFVALIVLPPAAHLLFRDWTGRPRLRRGLALAEAAAGLLLMGTCPFPGLVLLLLGVYNLARDKMLSRYEWFSRSERYVVPAAIIVTTLFLLVRSWLPIGVETGTPLNMVFVGLLIALALTFFKFFQDAYPRLLGWCLQHKLLFAAIPLSAVVAGGAMWARMGEEFMPPLDEGSFLYMPTTMPHASIGEALDVVKKLDMAVSSIPEVELSVGKLGRVDSSLDPAPISMFENIINYKSEYRVDAHGYPASFRYDVDTEAFVRDAQGQLIPDPDGRPYRQWRSHIRTPDDIWNEIVQVAKIPGVTSAPKLQPIAARVVMLQSGMRAPMGVKVKGPSLEIIDAVGQQIETWLKEVPTLEPATVVADRVVGKPYLEIRINRAQIARYGLTIKDVQDIIEVAVGGKPLTLTIEGRERYPVRIRYLRELRNDLETLGGILIPTPLGQHIPLRELADIAFERRAQVIKSEDTFLTSYVVFDKKSGHAEVEVVEAAQAYLQDKIARGEWQLPAGVSYAFAGSYENQLRAKKRLRIVIPLTLFVIFLILYLQFRSALTTVFIFSGIFVAWAGGFLLLWLYAQDWFLNFAVGETNFRDLFQVRPFNLSVAVWVGFIALFGIAADNGVLIATYLKQRFDTHAPGTREEIRAAVLEAAQRRIRPALMTTATTLLALLPVLTSRGRGADIMVPMAIPSFGGMAIALLTVFVVPVLYCWAAEFRAHRQAEG